ncbi:MAG TPA: hypothetical protein VF509_16195 [Sphingobium sp.]
MAPGAALRWRFVATICTGSFLLFLVQPMIARMALPRLGGAPTVWNSAAAAGDPARHFRLDGRLWQHPADSDAMTG